MEDNDMKKEYMKPTMKVVPLKQHYHILNVSNAKGAKSVKESDENWNWVTDGLEGEDV